MLKWLIATAVVLALGSAITWLAHGPLRRRHETEAGIAALSAMSWRAFIGIVLEALARRGFHRQVDRESAAGDSDYTLTRNGDQWLLSAKHGSAFVLGRAAVKELAAAMALSGAGGGLLLTQGRIADEARLAARGRPIQLLDGAALWPELRDLVPGLATVRESAARRARTRSVLGWLLALVAGAGAFMLAPEPRTVATATPAPVEVGAGTVASTATTPAAPGPDADPAASSPEAQRRELASTVATLPMVTRAQWTSASTLEVTVDEGDGDPFDAICPLVERYPALASSRIQLTPPAGSARPVRFRQCRSY